MTAFLTVISTLAGVSHASGQDIQGHHPRNGLLDQRALIATTSVIHDESKTYDTRESCISKVCYCWTYLKIFDRGPSIIISL